MGACRERCWKTDWVIDLDIRKFFDSVESLMVKAVEAHADLPWVVLYVKRWLHAPLALPTGPCDSGTGAPRKGRYVQLNIRTLMNSAGLCAAPAGEAW